MDDKLNDGLRCKLIVEFLVMRVDSKVWITTCYLSDQGRAGWLKKRWDLINTQLTKILYNLIWYLKFRLKIILHSMKESHFKSLGNSFPFRLKCIKSIFYLLPQTLVPSKPLTASSASLGSSISTNAKPGGLLATQTFLTGPYLAKASSRSYLKEYQVKKSLHHFSLQTFVFTHLLASSLRPPI